MLWLYLYLTYYGVHSTYHGSTYYGSTYYGDHYTYHGTCTHYGDHFLTCCGSTYYGSTNYGDHYTYHTYLLWRPLYLPCILTMATTLLNLADLHLRRHGKDGAELH